MELSNWLLFSSVAIVATISPGPAVFLSVTNSITHGLRKSVYSSLGNIIGLFFVSSSAALGLGALMQTSQLLFSILKMTGACYLIYLGIKQWRNPKTFFANTVEMPDTKQDDVKMFTQGLIVAISNPKVVLFFTALFPQFLDLSKPIMVQFLIFTTTFMFFSFFSLLIYALGARSATRWFRKGNRSLYYNRISGTLFIAFGLGLLRLRISNS